MLRQKATPPEIAKVYCPMCTHTVEARIQRPASARRAFVTPGQKCPHCSASLDAGYILPVSRAA
jgi:hypothetical protein